MVHRDHILLLQKAIFCGYRYDYHTDSDVKWHIAGHRILLSHLGRWNRRDPIGYLGGINPYRYCGNNTVNGLDPNGLTQQFHHRESGAIAGLVTSVVFVWRGVYDLTACTADLKSMSIYGLNISGSAVGINIGLGFGIDGYAFGKVSQKPCPCPLEGTIDTCRIWLHIVMDKIVVFNFPWVEKDILLVAASVSNCR